MKILSDLFKGIGNDHWELARIMAAWSVLSYSGAFIYALAAKNSVPDWSSLGVGFAALLAGSGALIGIKDFARAKSNAAEADSGIPPQGGAS
jgi:hypothetical protein